MSTETKKKKIDGVDSENELVDLDNEGVDNEILPSERKGYSLITPPPPQIQPH